MSIGAILVVIALLVAVVGLIVAIIASARRPCAALEEATPPEADVPAEKMQGTEGAEQAPRICHARPAYLEREARRELLLLDERLHRKLLDDPGMSPQEWAKIADSVVFVHDNMCPELAVERFERATDTKVTAPERTQLSPREVFARLNEQLSEDKQLRLLRELDDLVEADVYVPPERER